IYCLTTNSAETKKEKICDSDSIFSAEFKYISFSPSRKKPDKRKRTQYVQPPLPDLQRTFQCQKRERFMAQPSLQRIGLMKNLLNLSKEMPLIKKVFSENQCQKCQHRIRDNNNITSTQIIRSCIHIKEDKC
ncbi:hypothetical protein L9F63_022555, partial [Diploptera punctata]